MSRIVSIHSFREEIGKTTIAANVAAHQALSGLRVGLFDANLHSPGVIYPFHINEDEVRFTLNDYLWRSVDIMQVPVDVTAALATNSNGKILVMPKDARLYLIPASPKAGDIARMMREGYDVGLLNDAFHAVVEELNLDVLVLDTQPGLHEETLLSIAISDALLICFRPRAKDYQGTAVSVEVARKLDVPTMGLVLNMVPATFDVNEVKVRVEKTYNAEVMGVLPFSDVLMCEDHPVLFSLRYPDHLWSLGVEWVARQVMG